jgi:hypothetical protein
MNGNQTIQTDSIELNWGVKSPGHPQMSAIAKRQD